MNKQQFIEEMRKRLNNLSENDINKSLDYYEEMIQDRMEEGLSEEEAVEGLGSIDDIVSQILSDTSLPKIHKPSVKIKNKMSTWEIVLLILGFPIWFPLLLTAFILIISFYIIIWSVILSLYSAVLALGVSSLGSAAGACMMTISSEYAQAVCYFSAFLICSGLTIIAFFGLWELTKLTVFITKKSFLLLNKLFKKRRNYNE